MNKIDTVINELEDYANSLGEKSQSYWKYHKKRYIWFIHLVTKIVESYFSEKMLNILDIAPLYQTLLLDKVYNDFVVDTLGYRNGPFHPNKSIHYEFDLNDCYYKDKWIHINNKYDLIVMLEVIEHLSTSPTQVFSFLSELLSDEGILIIQTPNAVSLVKRYKMLKGLNPFELIRENMRDDPGHFREYTRDELCYLASIAGFEVRGEYMVNYFKDGGSFVERMLDRISSYMPGNYGNGMTIIFQKCTSPRKLDRVIL